MIDYNSPLFNSYLEVLKDRLFKIIPLIEENNEGIYQYIDSLIFELYGLQYVINGVKSSSSYLIVLTTLESIQDELIVNERDFMFIRGEVFKLLGHIDKLKREGE